MGKRKSGPRKGSKQFSLRTKWHRYRSPFSETRGDVTTWWVRRRELATGKVERIRLKAATADDANQEVLALIGEDTRRLTTAGVEEGAPVPVGPPSPKTLTVKDAFAKFLAKKDVAAETMAAYEREARKFVALFGPNRLVATITADDVRDVITKKWPSRKPLSGRSIRKLRFALIEFFQYLIDELEILARNPARRFKEERSWRIEEQRALRETRNPFKPEEIAKLVAAAEGEMLLFLILVFQVGLRKSNTVGSAWKSGLTWGNFRNLFEPGKEKLVIEAESMKWKGSSFSVPVHAEVGEALREHARELGRVPDPTERVFTMKPRELDDAWKALQKKAGVEVRRLHDTRHTASQRWVRHLVSIDICHKLEHHALTGVHSKYGQQEEEDIRAALAAVPRLIEKKAEPKKRRARPA